MEGFLIIIGLVVYAILILVAIRGTGFWFNYDLINRQDKIIKLLEEIKKEL